MHLTKISAKKVAKKATIVALLASCTLLSSFSFAQAGSEENFDRNLPAHKSSLLELYNQWSAKRKVGPEQQASIRISPVSAKVSNAAKITIKTTDSTTADAITDAEILAQAEAETNDPLEPLNRLVFGFNEILDLIIFTPISHTYRTVVPNPLREGVANVVANAKAPVTLVNDLLQGKPERAQTTFMRFLINTTVGLGGFVDAAEAGGFEKHTEDFGQTLAVWGVGSGPYLVAPVFGPTSPRHIVGRLADTAATPTTWVLADFSLLKRSTPTIADLVTSHEILLDDITSLRQTSPDFYASVRDIYQQSRKNAILDGDLEIDPIPDLPLE